MNKFKTSLTIAVGTAAALLSAPQAWATACTNPLVVDCTGDGLTYLGTTSTTNQSNAAVATDVEAFLAGLGFTGETYLGRQDGSGDIDGDSVTTSSSDGGLSGTWTFTPGTTGDVGAFIAIHAGGGQTDEVWEVNSPGDSGEWATFESANLSNFDLFGTDGSTAVPEPASLALLGSAIVGFGLMRRRRKNG